MRLAEEIGCINCLENKLDVVKRNERNERRKRRKEGKEERKTQKEGRKKGKEKVVNTRNASA